MPSDLYEVLQVQRNASAADKKSYRRLAREFHPDTNPDLILSRKRVQRDFRLRDTLGSEENHAMTDSEMSGTPHRWATPLAE